MEVNVVSAQSGGGLDLGHVQINIPDDNDVQAGTGAEEEYRNGWLPFTVGFILGPRNWSNPVWRLRLIAIFCLVLTVVASAFWLPGDLRASRTIYQRVVFFADFIAPVAVATGSLVLSCWMDHEPNAWANWATWLSVANGGITAGALILYLVGIHWN